MGRRVACVRVTYDIRQRFVDPEHHGSSIPARRIPAASVSCATAPRTAQSVSGSLRNSISAANCAGSRGVLLCLGTGRRGEIVMNSFAAFFCKIEMARSFRQEPHFAVQIPLQDGLAILVRKLAMNVNRGLPATVVTLRAISLPFLNPRTVL